MTDEKNKTSPDDEYQFPRDEYVDAGHENTQPGVEPEQPAASAAKPRGPIGKLADHLRHFPEIKNKRIVLAIVGVIFLAIVFHIVKKDNSTLPPVAQEQQEVQVPQPVPVVQPVVQTDPNMMNSLDALQQRHSKTESRIHELEGQVSDLQTSLTQSQATTEQLQKSIAVLTSQVQDLTSQLNKVLTQIKGPRAAKIVYHLRAVVPDRAWIISSNGETISVTIGDHIDQYGKVISIDSVHGVIDTSSGRKIQYGVNDY